MKFKLTDFGYSCFNVADDDTEQVARTIP
jgi:hypothetical protein